MGGDSELDSTVTVNKQEDCKRALFRILFAQSHSSGLK